MGVANYSVGCCERARHAYVFPPRCSSLRRALRGCKVALLCVGVAAQPDQAPMWGGGSK